MTAIIGMDLSAWPRGNERAVELLARMRGRLVRGYLAHIRDRVPMAWHTRYRTLLADELESLIRSLDKLTSWSPVLPARTRALMIMPMRPLSSDVQQEHLRTYVNSVALGRPVERLEKLAVRTDSAELVRRLLRYGKPPHAKGLRDYLKVLEVMNW